MNKQYEMVKEFQTKMGQPVANKPVIMELKRRLDRHGYMQEELDEFRDAETLVDQVDGLIDLAYLVNGTLVEMGVLPEKLFEIVHNANMSKLWPDGKPRTNPETGKIIKPPTFVAPEPLLQEEIDKQLRTKYRVHTEYDVSIEVDTLTEAEEIFNSWKDDLMAEGVDFTDSFVGIAASVDDFEDHEIIKKVVPVIDEEKQKYGTPKDQGYSFEFWAKWQEV